MDLFIMILLGTLGAILGSFLACMGYRIPNKIKTTYPSSFCSNCKKSLKWYMNVPIISYLLLRGKCYWCKKSIGFIYFFCEVLCSILFILCYKLFGISFNFFIGIILSCTLIVTIVSDFLYFYISDRVLVITIIASLITMLFYISYNDILMKLLSGVTAFLVMLGIKIMGNSMFNKESLGDGDIKLMGVIGFNLGLMNSFISLFASSVTALIYAIFAYKKSKDGVIPFGPFLLIGALLVLLLQDYITPIITEFLSI